jgi:hypothetical protein
VIESVVAEGFVKVGEEVLRLGTFIEDSYCYLDQVNVRTDGILGKCLVDRLKEAGKEVSEISLYESHYVLYQLDYPFNVHIFIIGLASRFLQPGYQIRPSLPSKRFQHTIPFLKVEVTQLLYSC